MVDRTRCLNNACVLLVCTHFLSTAITSRHPDVRICRPVSWHQVSGSTKVAPQNKQDRVGVFCDHASSFCLLFHVSTPFYFLYGTPPPPSFSPLPLLPMHSKCENIENYPSLRTQGYFPFKFPSIIYKVRQTHRYARATAI